MTLLIYAFTKYSQTCSFGHLHNTDTSRLRRVETRIRLIFSSIVRPPLYNKVTQICLFGVRIKEVPLYTFSILCDLLIRANLFSDFWNSSRITL